MAKVPNQRTITIKKDWEKGKLYTINTLEAIDEALYRLQSKLGIKLYLYLAKNQDKYRFDFFSSDFCKLCRCSLSGYNTAFKELEEQGYLIKKEGTQTIYTFYEKSQNQEQPITIENDIEAVKQREQIKEEMANNFVF